MNLLFSSETSATGEIEEDSKASYGGTRRKKRMHLSKEPTASVGVAFVPESGKHVRGCVPGGGSGAVSREELDEEWNGVL